MITSDEIKRRLWNGANELRGSMDASRYKDYMLGLMFYKFLSDKTLQQFKITSGLAENNEQKLVEEYKKSHQEYGDELTKMIQSVLGYYVLPDNLYQTWIIDINSGQFEVQKVTDSLNSFERTVAVSSGADDFKGLFSTSMIDLTDTALGSNLNERSKNIKELILLFADLNMVALQKGDVLGDAYEYLIGQFAMESGKKAGEFYTPRQVSEVMAQIVAKSSDIDSIYDPTVGSGSLLLTVGKHLNADKRLNYYGQEKNTATFNLTRMNLLLHGVRPEHMTVKNGDTLAEDWPEDPERPNEGVQFDAIVMNPPYSVKNWNKSELKVSDPRFAVAGALPPDSKGDYAFLLHGLFHLRQHGTMAIVLPHGVLFRGGAEGIIRKRLLEKNNIDTIIGLPDKLFTNTGIPVTVIILKKNRDIDAPVLMIDASKEFTKVGKQNVLQEKDIAKIVDTYVERREEKGYSHLATQKDIAENEYNLNIPRYIEALETDIPENVDAHLFGGIPREDLTRLTVLNTYVSDVLEAALDEIRPGYVMLDRSIDDLTETALNHESLKALANELTEKMNKYTAHYWEVLKNVADVDHISDIRNDMYNDIKKILATFAHVNTYDGYQIIAEIWESMLTEDTEKIAIDDFYAVARTREENMVTKGQGKKKREVQEGWNGSLVPNDLIMKHLYQEELTDMETNKEKLQAAEAEIAEYVEAAKVEESDEEFALAEALNDKEDAFTKGGIKEALKEAEKEAEAYELVKKVEKLLNEKTKLASLIKKEEKALKDAVEERILTLTDEEIDTLMYGKWFGQAAEKMVQLIEQPVKDELATLKELKERYSETLDTMEQEEKDLEEELEAMMQELVVTE